MCDQTSLQALAFASPGGRVDAQGGPSRRREWCRALGSDRVTEPTPACQGKSRVEACNTPAQSSPKVRSRSLVMK